RTRRLGAVGNDLAPPALPLLPRGARLFRTGAMGARRLSLVTARPRAGGPSRAAPGQPCPRTARPALALAAFPGAAAGVTGAADGWCGARLCRDGESPRRRLLLRATIRWLRPGRRDRPGRSGY